ncbi:hypothetical protein ABMA28_009914 [Loxostege sticticalis]|uniref:Integrase catalytic domain-containing protein n=1 Tax=Loxostege sticticalis TaxID=481309 RepID=A0ABD0SDY4_LOXSC
MKKIDSKVYSQDSTILGVCQGVQNSNQKAQFDIYSRISDFKLKVNCCIVDSITCDLPQFKIDRSNLDLGREVLLADENFDKSASIDVLLGCDVLLQALLHSAEPLKEEGPYLLKTQFGDVIAGSLPPSCVSPSGVSNSISVQGHVSQNLPPTTNHNACVVKSHEDNLGQISSISELNENISKFWQAEKVPEIYSEQTTEQELAESIFQQSVILENNRFTVALPLKQPITKIYLGDSFSIALQRLYNLERRLVKNETLYQMYKDFINEYLSLGHAEPYDVSNYDLDKDACYFLPHHPVFNENSPTTKMRTVFDGSLKTKNKISLNDVLLNGPIVQNELFDILILFRLPKYILLCDVKKMFRQILLHPQYRALQNILWRESVDDDVSCIQLKTVTYGMKSSSYLATRCLIELAERFKVEYSLAANVLKTQTYVDDVLTGHNNINVLLSIKKQLIELLKLGGFELHKWGSNDSRLLDNIAPNEASVKDIDMSKDDSFLKTLGLRYNVKSDHFYIRCSETNLYEEYTKRQVLSFVSKIFDPLGLVGPIVVSAKLLMQSIYNLKVSWDEKLPKDINDQWISFAKNLIEMPSILSKRHIDIQDARQVELIGFADASNKAYGCCLYVRSIKDDDTVETNLLCSKSRANSSNNELSTPRKELNSALLLSMLTKRVFETLKSQCNNLKVCLYLDSQIVLAWLNIEPVKLLPYVANRVAKIKELTADWPWFYVKTTDNPADCLSRGVEPHGLQSNELWWHGPQFLKQASLTHGSAMHEVLDPQDLPELKKQCCNILSCNNTCHIVNDASDATSFFARFSNINKLKRVVAYMLRFSQNCKIKNSSERCVGELQPSELENALFVIIKCDQQKHYEKEFACVKANKPVKGSLSALNPFVDKNGLLRVGGRLENSQLPYAQKHPVILHENLLHAGPKLLLASLNNKFWLINAVREIKRVIHKCIKCFKLKAKAASQLMGSLPSDRVTAARPFEKVGIDYAGPFNIKLARVRKPLILKSYVLILVCFVTKAVHFELASDMTTACFLNCFKRFIARRNKPSQVFCDNATTFKCADSQLQNLYKLQSSASHQSTVQRFSAEQGITFNFIPAYSPSLKYHIKRVIGDTVLTYEEFNTAIIQIEAILNSRPLTPMSADPSDMSYLSPSHFLTGAPITSFPEQDLTDRPVNRLHFWEQCTQIKQHFFKQWHKQYLSMLQNRPKWKHDTPNIDVGTLVILRDKNIQPFNWPMARVVKLYPGNDNKVRAFDVKMPNGYIMRTSITKVCPLPIYE